MASDEDWVKAANERCEAAMRGDTAWASHALHDLPRALAVIEAADRLAEIAGPNWMNDERLDQALAAYRKARHG